MRKRKRGPAEVVMKRAQDYAWGYFAYHAQQRQTVFNFYLIVVGACIAAFASTLGESGVDHRYFRVAMGGVLVLASFLFWRLDVRNSRLVKLAEKALKPFESELAKQLHNEDMCLVKIADQKFSKYPMSEIERFGQIFQTIFVLVGATGMGIAIAGIF